jgi:hypothetical protein
VTARPRSESVDHSRVGFAHAFQPLGQEELRFVLAGCGVMQGCGVKGCGVTAAGSRLRGQVLRSSMHARPRPDAEAENTICVRRAARKAVRSDGVSASP